MAEEEDESTWILELEGALQENCYAHRIYEICKGKAFPEHIRTEAWQACLEIQNKKDQMTNFNEIYDLPEQEILRQDCQSIVDKLGNDDWDKVSVVSDVESILTYYCKSNNLQYHKENGWIELLLPILALKKPKSETYNIFEAVINRYLPKSSTKDIYHLLRLLILYHDPELCSFLDTKKATPDLYASSWFKNLFAGTCYLKVVQSIWDYYFQQNSPFFVFFLSLVIVLNWREQMLAFKNEPKNKIVESISAMPSALEHNDVSDFCSLAQYYSLKTPKSFKKELFDVLFCSSEDSECSFSKQSISQILCLPVSTNELVENISENEFFEGSDDPIERVRFFLVDCRPAEQYNAGHLPTAFHLDCNLMLQEPAAFNVAVQGLFSAQKQSIAANSSAGGEHLCFLGSGRDEEDQYTHMVVASFLQKNTQYISMLTGGYQAIHDYFGNDMLDCLEDHDPKKCVVCNSNSSSSNKTVADSNHACKQFDGQDLFGKISEVVKTKSADFKEKLKEFIVNPSASGDGERHVSPRDKVGKLYRNLAPVFSIDDENGPGPVKTDSVTTGKKFFAVSELMRVEPDMFAVPLLPKRRLESRHNCVSMICKLSCGSSFMKDKELPESFYAWNRGQSLNDIAYFSVALEQFLTFSVPLSPSVFENVSFQRGRPVEISLIRTPDADRFTISDALYYGEEEEEEITQEIVSLSSYLKSDKTKAHFQCREVKENGYMYESYLLINDNHLVVLRELSKRKGCALLVVKRPLSTIARITSKKKYPNLITFKYGRTDGKENVIYDMDRFIIPMANEAIQLISQQILNP